MANNEHGDFQTPRELATLLLETIPQKAWDEIIEPTCGTGNFLWAASKKLPNIHRVGVELQDSYIPRARKYGDVIQADVFNINFKRDLPLQKPDGNILVIGNPPWVTNSALSVMGSINKPPRTKWKKARGIDAITGSSNFDITEFIWLKLLIEFSTQPCTIALLCKTQVARNVLVRSEELGLPITQASIYEIDAKKWFQVNVDACWFVVSAGPGRPIYTAEVFSSLDERAPSKYIGVINGQFIADMSTYARAKGVDGESPLEWRQGVKHDASAVMELLEDDNIRTRRGSIVSIEDDYIFPLLKSTDVFHGRSKTITKLMIVTQRHTGDNTNILKKLAPKLWDYLEQHSSELDNRKSSIYRNKSRFSIFGVGDYTFLPYKVAVSGFHKEARFRLIGPINKKPVVFDDTCYLLSFDDPIEAALVHTILNSLAVKNLLNSIVSWDSKRPITKKVLQRIDLLSVAECLERHEVAKSTVITLKEELNLDALQKEVLKRLDNLLDEWNIPASKQLELGNEISNRAIAMSPVDSRGIT